MSERMGRERIFARDGWRCVYCGEGGTADELTLDHVEPRRIGGDGSDGNLVTACRACNARKAGLAAWQYLARRPEEREHFLEHATAVWPRLLRAIVEAAEKEAARGARCEQGERTANG